VKRWGKKGRPVSQTTATQRPGQKPRRRNKALQAPPSQVDGWFRISLVRKIADGGMGSLYEAVLYGAQGFKKTIAVKTVLESYSEDQDFLEMFVGEAKLVADLVHQNICQVYHLGRWGKRTYIAMEFITGVNLKEFIRRHGELGRQVPWALGTFIVSRVCRGLEYAHGKRDKNGQLLGVVHRDVSFKNIMISTEGEVKLTDFGVAKARKLMRDREGEVRVGSAQTMAPEQVKFQPTDARTDLFALGVILFELLTGQRLFAARTTKGTLRNVLRKKIPQPSRLNPEIPPGIERIILKALSRDPNTRYQSAGAMGYDLEYEIYHQGYGPTIVTLEKYLHELFPGMFLGKAESSRQESLHDSTLTMRPSEVVGDDRERSASTVDLHPRRRPQR
jgi:serine/threonine-protein kinase